MDGTIELPEIQRYLEHCVKEHLSSYFKGVPAMSEAVKDDVSIHNILKPHGGFGDGMGLGGLGGGLLGGILAAALFGGRRGGIFGGGDCDGAVVRNGGGETRIEDTVFNTAVLTKLGTIEAAIPYNEAQLQLAISNQTNALQQQGNANTAALTLAVGGVKDTVQNVATLLLQAGSNNTEKILAAICALSSKIDANTIANLQAELAEVKSVGRSREVEVNVSQNVNQQQAQLQAQAQFGTLRERLDAIIAEHQRTQQGIVNLGTMVGNTQSAANTATRVN